MMKRVSIILPAHDEAAIIGTCLNALLGSDALPDGWLGEVIVVANGCSDATGAVALAHQPQADARGWTLQVLDLPEGGKLNALNRGDGAASGGIRVYLDADVSISPPLIRQLVEALDTDRPRYASGQARIAPAQSRFTTWYGRFWVTLPFVQTGVPGFGVFAMNAAGRARWGHWPDIVSDDTFARLSFAPSERVGVAAPYYWPMVEGFANLVRVRRRQNDGVDQIASHFPSLLANDDKPRLSPLGLLGRAVRDPLGFVAYVAVALAVKTPFVRSDEPWARGR